MFAKSAEKTLVLESLFNKVKGDFCTGFFQSICEIFKNTFFKEHFPWLLLIFMSFTSLLRLLEKHNALQLPFSIFFCFSATFFTEYQGIRSKKVLYRSLNSYRNSVICYYKRRFFWSILFLNQSQRREMPPETTSKIQAPVYLYIIKIARAPFTLERNI